MRKFSLILLLLVPFALFSQNWEVGAMLGAMNYNGDLTKPYTVFGKETHPSLGVAVRLNTSKYLSFRAQFLYGAISGADTNNTESNSTFNRGLSFKSNIYELGIQMEFHFTRLFASRYRRTSKTSMYAFLGISGFRYNPKTEYNGEWVELQPLGTEGQGTDFGLEDKYSLYSVAIPFGLAFKTSLNPNWNIIFEISCRKTFTDHIDDVGGYYIDYETQKAENPTGAILSNRSWEHINKTPEELNRGGDNRGNPAIKDYYYFTGFTITRIIQCRDHCFRF